MGRGTERKSTEYYTNSPNFCIFNIRSTIHLEYEGTSFSEWSVSAPCSVKDRRSTKTELRCSSPGYHHIKPIVTGPVKESRYLSVDNSQICFLWYYRVNYFNFPEVIFIWVYDPENADHDELLWKANEPSLNSIILTKQFTALGQKPAIYTILRRKQYFPTEPLKNGVWKISIPMRKDDIVKNIVGNKVAFQDCFVADFVFLLTLPVMTIPEIPGYLPLSTPSGSQLIVDWDACVPSAAVVVTEMETFQTNDSFLTWTKIRVPPGILNDDERHHVTDMCLSEGRIFFIINGILYLKDFLKFTRLGRNENLPDDGIIGITSRRWCWVNYLFKSQGKRSSMAVWTENEVYLGSPYQPSDTRQQEPYNLFRFNKIITTTELKNLLRLSSTASLTIHSVDYTAHPLELALLLSYCVACTSSKKIYLVIYNEDTKQWMYQDFALDVPIDSFLVSHFLYSATPELLLSDKHRIYYSYHNFTVSGILQAPVENGNLSRLSQNSSIHDVFLDYFGNIVIKMENNIMFYSKVNIEDVIQLHSWTNKAIQSFFGLDISGQLYFVYIFENGTLQPQKYPLQLEAQSVIFQTNENCPYIAFHTSLTRIFYVLDKREVLSFWVQVTYPESSGLYIILESYGPKIIKEKRKFTFEVILGYCTKTMYVTFSQAVNYEAVDDYFKLQDQTSGLVLFNFRPSKYSKACTAPKKVIQVAVGCNSKKYIAVKGQKVKYDWESYGCPLRLDFRKKFKPSIQFLGAPSSRAVLHDLGATSLSGCLNEAQTWKSMTELNKHLPLEKAWGPENYKHCFSYAIGKPGDLNQPYEIINKSNYNHIIWPLDHSGMYVFSVKILDPNYSFCNLTAIFAIETFGLITRPNGYLVASFLFLLMLLFFSILVLSYLHYMKIYRQYIYEPLSPEGKQKKM
ncbi:cation channel sperm-associated auxiliary subunit epsilon [Trichechus manatus latirostris]|uniref:Cation channel sperm-associated auxiliary subunit epsilon n=1 Tax=Trichechus manatus latirostris TaxID=127582 RepID=A0A2Y9FZZ0_TRIMA|nr:cation channel sperm-associated auxiliary subunit epsilon [Trichechus manatus latirostris]